MEKKDFEKVQTLKANLRHCKKKFLKSKSVAKVASVGGGVLGTLVGIFAGLNTYDGLYRNNLQHINEIELSSVNAGFILIRLLQVVLLGLVLSFWLQEFRLHFLQLQNINMKMQQMTTKKNIFILKKNFLMLMKMKDKNKNKPIAVASFTCNCFFFAKQKKALRFQAKSNSAGLNRLAKFIIQMQSRNISVFYFVCERRSGRLIKILQFFKFAEK